MYELLIILSLILLNGVFAGAEIAILSVRHTRLAELVAEGSRAARAVTALRAEPDRFLATVQIGITVIGATAAAFGGASVAIRVMPLLASIPALAPYAEELSIGAVVIGVSYLSLVLGELVPKSLALRASEPYALLIARPLAALAWVGRPLVAVLTVSSNLVLRLFGDRTSFSESRISSDELRQIVDDAAQAGSVDAHAGEIASRALLFSELDAHAVMVPRARITMIPRDATVDELARISLEQGHARLPVFDPLADDVIGFVNAREALALAATGQLGAVADAIRPILFVPASLRAPVLLRRLQAERASIALVADERGTILGLVTVEDLVEELVGEILSESDEPGEPQRHEAAEGWTFPGDAPVHEVERAIGAPLPSGDFSTVGGLCLHLAGEIPAAGARLTTEDGLILEVLDASARRVRRLRVRRAPPDLTA